MHTINLQIDLSSLDKIGLLKAFLEKLPFVKAIRFWENETEYLLAHPINKERLLESLAQAEGGEIVSFEDLESLMKGRQGAFLNLTN